MEQGDIAKWTSEELCQVYDLQKGLDETILNFIRYDREQDVMDFLAILPQLYGYSGKAAEPYFFRSEDVSLETAVSWGIGEAEAKKHDYIYRDFFGKFKTADDLREVYEGTLQNEIGFPHPEILALAAGNYELAKEGYSREEYDALRACMPEAFQHKMDILLAKFPEDIRKKAMQGEVYGCTGIINRTALYAHRNKNLTEYERVQEATEQASSDDIVAAYDLQMRLSEAVPELSDESMTRAVREFCSWPDSFRVQFGSKAYNAIAGSGDDALDVACNVDLVHTKEKVPAVENHKICLYGTKEQIMAIPYDDCAYEVSEQDAKVYLGVLADCYEREGFSQRYVARDKENVEYLGQPYQVIGRAKPNVAVEVPEWNIAFEDGNIIKANAYEVIPSKIPDVMKELYLPDPTPRKLEEATLPLTERPVLTRKEAESKLRDLLKDFRRSGVKATAIRDLLDRAGRSVGSVR